MSENVYIPIILILPFGLNQRVFFLKKNLPI